MIKIVGKKMDRRKRLRNIFILVIILGVCSVSFIVAINFNPRNSENDVDYNMVKVIRRDIGNDIQATGILKPRIGADVIVGTRTSGLIKDVYVRIGEKVREIN